MNDEGATGETKKARKELPAGAVATLKAWLLSPEHFTHPYPSPQEQTMLMQKTGIDAKQLKNCKCIKVAGSEIDLYVAFCSDYLTPYLHILLFLCIAQGLPTLGGASGSQC